MIDKARTGVKINGMGELNVKVLSKFSKEIVKFSEKI